MEPNSSASGDAAASLASLFAASGLGPAPSSNPASATVHRPSSVDPSANPTASSAGGGGAWRLKLLQKVGIPEASGRSGIPEAASSFRSSSSGAGAADELEAVRESTPRRSEHAIRSAYIKKLEASRAFLPQLNRPKTSQTVTIFDWDDTLLCTSHLEMVQRQYGAIPSQVRSQLASLEKIVQTLLRQAKERGAVFIITNASEGWVQHSSSLCMPGTASRSEASRPPRPSSRPGRLLASLRPPRARCLSNLVRCAGLQEDLATVEIISARAGFEASFPGDSHAWKMHAFLLVQNKLQLEAVTNLVSIGDSHIEMDAVHLLGRSFAHALVKTVKLWERPTPYELEKQLEIVAEKFPDIYRAGTTLNIWLEREHGS